MFRQGIDKLELSVEQNTPNVPADGQYHILLGGRVVGSYATERSAVTRYKELRDKLIQDVGPTAEFERASPSEIRRREALEFDAYQARLSGSQSKQDKINRKGGRGVGRR